MEKEYFLEGMRDIFDREGACRTSLDHARKNRGEALRLTHEITNAILEVANKEGIMRGHEVCRLLMKDAVKNYKLTGSDAFLDRTAELVSPMSMSYDHFLRGGKKTNLAAYDFAMDAAASFVVKGADAEERELTAGLLVEMNDMSLDRRFPGQGLRRLKFMSLGLAARRGDYDFEHTLLSDVRKAFLKTADHMLGQVKFSSVPVGSEGACPKDKFLFTRSLFSTEGKSIAVQCADDDACVECMVSSVERHVARIPGKDEVALLKKTIEVVANQRPLVFEKLLCDPRTDRPLVRDVYAQAKDLSASWKNKMGRVIGGPYVIKFG